MLSYAQRFEDLILLRCFGDQSAGFYIDIGAGHPVHDNVSFAFYLRGWSGVTVEPNPKLHRLSLLARPRDRSEQLVIGASSGEAEFFLVEEFHGFSTLDAEQAERAQVEFGKSAERLDLPMLTLRALCERAGLGSIDFLKIDVEGAEKDVIAGGDWQRFRPKLVLAEALAPYTLEPAWREWEPLLLNNGYRYAGFDTLNRYYVAEEAAELGERLVTDPRAYEGAQLFGELKPAPAEPRHPDHALAKVFEKALFTMLPALDPKLLFDLITLEIGDPALERPATEQDCDRALARLFGEEAGSVRDLGLPQGGSLRALYEAIVNSDAFRLRCTRVAAGYDW